jgi:hypothetical protein
MNSDDFANIAILSGVILVFAIAWAIKHAKLTAGGARFKMAVTGVVLNEAFWIASSLTQGRLRDLSNFDWLWQLEFAARGAIVALVFYEIIWRTRSRFQARTFWMYAAAVWYLSFPINAALFVVTSSLHGRMSGPILAYYSDPKHWVVPGFVMPYFVLDVLYAVALTGMAYVLIYGVMPGVFALSARAHGGYGGGGKMSSDETTRLLCASAFLSGSSFRKSVMERFEDRNHAPAPEIGLDVALVAQVCRYAEKRERKYFSLFLLCGIAFGGFALIADPTAGIALGVVCSAVIFFVKNTEEQRIVRRHFERGVFEPSKVKAELAADLDADLVAAFPADDQNLIVYRGFTPFVGAGSNLGGWSFIVDTAKPAEATIAGRESAEPVRFTSDELYAAIDTAIASLGLDRLTVRDYCFVSGNGIRESREILPCIYERPVQILDGVKAAEYRCKNDAQIRHYQWIRVHDWGNELVMSYFLRSAVRGTSLFVEINRFLLTPLQDTYHAVDKLAASDWKNTAGIAFGSIFAGPALVIGALFTALGKFNTAIERITGSKEKAKRREIERDPAFDYGAANSLRQTLSSGYFAHYFQKLDGEFYTKVLEHEILDAIVVFLEEHNIDTSELRERRTMILNSGIIVQGGDVTAESLAVGAGAMATKNAQQAHAPAKAAAKGAGA